MAEDAVADAKLAIKLDIAPGNAIMQSLTENLPDATGEKVFCYYITTPSAAIQCKNVGRLLASKTYQIGVKINFPNSQGSIPATFGKITGYIWKTSAYDTTNPYIVGAVATELASITLVANTDMVK